MIPIELKYRIGSDYFNENIFWNVNNKDQKEMMRTSYMMIRDILIYEYEYLDTTDELIQSLSIEVSR